MNLAVRIHITISTSNFGFVFVCWWLFNSALLFLYSSASKRLHAVKDAFCNPANACSTILNPTKHPVHHVHLCNSLSLGVLLGGLGDGEGWCELLVWIFSGCALAQSFQGIKISILEPNKSLGNVLGGNDCLNFSAFSESLTIRVYKWRWQRTLNLEIWLPLVFFMRAAFFQISLNSSP